MEDTDSTQEKEFTFVLVLDNRVLTDPTAKISELSTHKIPTVRIMETFCRLTDRGTERPKGSTNMPDLLKS